MTSLLAIVALLAAKYLGWQWMDPAMGIVGAVLVTRWACGLLRDSGGVLLDRQNPDLETAIRHSLEHGEERISDLHVWSIGPGLHAAIVALVSDQPRPAHYYRDKLRDEMPGLVHVTVQVERCTKMAD